MNLLKTFFRKILPQGGFIRNVSILAGGTTLSQSIILLATPLITRLYTPDDLGILGVFTSFLTISLVVSSLRYEIAIPLPTKDHDAFNLLVIAILINVGISILIIPFIVFFAQPIATLISVPEISSWLYLLPVGLLFAGLYKALYYWNIRKSKFGTLSKTKFIQSFSMVGIQLAAFKLASLGLILGQIAGRTAGFSTMVKDLWKKDYYLFSHVNWKSLRRMAKRYVKLPMYSTWNGFFNTAGMQLPPVFFAALFSPAAAGIYAIMTRVLTLPINLISNAVADVFFSSASRSYQEGKLSEIIEKIYGFLIELIIPVALILIFSGPIIFSFVLGKEWMEAGILARWFAPWMVFAFITIPLSRLFSILEKESLGAAFQAILLITRVTIIFVIYRITQNFVITAISFAIGTTVVYIGIMLWCLSAGGVSILKGLIIFIKKIPYALLLVSPLIIVYVIDIFTGMVKNSITIYATLVSIVFVSLHSLKLSKGI
ncbi:MAG: lipopolysaccharide biosynthesis protein [Bacteroidales bacterium]